MINFLKLIRRRITKSRQTAEPAGGGEEAVSSLLSRDSGKQVYPAARDLLERPIPVERIAPVEDSPWPEGANRQSAMDRIRALPPLKQAIVWSEILKEPKGM